MITTVLIRRSWRSKRQRAGDVMTGAIMAVMSFGDGEKGYRAARKEQRRSLEAEKKQIPSAETEEPTCRYLGLAY